MYDPEHQWRCVFETYLPKLKYKLLFAHTSTIPFWDSSRKSSCKNRSHCSFVKLQYMRVKFKLRLSQHRNLLALSRRDKPSLTHFLVWILGQWHYTLCMKIPRITNQTAECVHTPTKIRVFRSIICHMGPCPQVMVCPLAAGRGSATGFTE
jgi:hypothetical protein